MGHLSSSVEMACIFTKLKQVDVNTSDEKMSLVALDEETETVHVSSSSRIPPDWVNYLDEAQYELTR